MEIVPTKSGKWNKWHLVLLSLALVAVALALIWPKTPKPPRSVANLAQLESFMQRLVNNGSPPGMSFVVVKDGRIVYSKGFGWADHPRKVPATPETVYHWWSCTKIPTAIAILQLQEMGKLQIDDPVSKYLPFFNVQYPSTQSKAITIRNLLTHSSGLPEPGMRIVSWIHHDGAPSVNQTELVQRVLPEYSKLVFEPGDHSEYTNLGYMVLGAIIEKVTGRAYEEYVKEHILDPLEMKHTAFLYTEAMGPHEACGSHPIFNIYTPLVPFIGMSYVREISGGHLWFKRVYNDQTPPTGLIGSATDAARLVAAYMSGGQLDGRRILSRESITVMTREGHTKGKDASPQSKRRQGIGWQVNAGNGRMFLQHEGGGLGFRTIIRLYPDENLGFVLFNNDVTCENWGIIDLAATLTW